MNLLGMGIVALVTVAAAVMSWYVWQPSQSSGYRTRNFLKAIRN
jgi:hypothetical protein